MSEPRSVLIVDDEPPARERLQRLIGEMSDWRVVGSCASGLEALECVGSLKPAIVLLDIRMPGLSGLETARRLSALECPPAVVFTTAYEQHALEAFDSQAVGYLLKPVRRERLQQALAHAARLVRPGQEAAPAPASPARRHIAVRLRGELRLIPVQDVVYFRADQKYVTVRHLRGEELIDEPLRQLEQEFAAQFVRAHRSLLVNIEHVEALERSDDGAYSLRLRHGSGSLPVSRRQLGDLKQRLRARRGRDSG